MGLKKIFIGLGFVAFFLLGLCLDRLYLTLPPGEFLVQNTATPTVAVVDIHSIGSGYLTATVTGAEARLVAGEVIATPDPATGEVSLALTDALLDYATVPVPEDALFVASVNGTRYYPLGHSGVQRISPTNRIFFRTAAEAEAAGYLPAQ